MKLHIHHQILEPTTLSVTYARREVFRGVIEPGTREVDVQLPAVAGKGDVVLFINGKEKWITGMTFRYATAAGARQLREKAAALVAAGRRVKAEYVLYEALYVLKTFDPRCAEMALVQEDIARVNIEMRCRSNARGVRMVAAQRHLQEAKEIWKELGEESAAARCQTEIESLAQRIDAYTKWVAALRAKYEQSLKAR